MSKTTIPTLYTKQIAESVAETLKCSKKDAVIQTETVINTIVEKLLAGNKINLKELGIFVVKVVPERKTRNPKTGEAGVKPSCRKLNVRATSAFKKRIN